MKLTSSCGVCFSGLAAKSRMVIVNLLHKKGRMSVLEVTKHFRLTQPTITHHLHYLKESGILSSEKKGRQVFYFLDPKCKRKECHVLD